MKFLLMSFLFAAAAPAAEYQTSLDGEFDRLVQTGAFYKPANLPLTPKNYERAVQASVRIGATGETCSAALISKDGYVATAIHCIEKCIKPVWGYNPVINVEWPSLKNVFDGVRVLEQAPARLQCPDYITSNFYIWDHHLNNARLVWLGRGYITNDEKELVRFSPTAFAPLKDLSEDLAILKYDFEGEPQDLPCVPVVDKAPAAGAPVWALVTRCVAPGTITTATRSTRASAACAHRLTKIRFFEATRKKSPRRMSASFGITSARCGKKTACCSQLCKRPTEIVAA